MIDRPRGKINSPRRQTPDQLQNILLKVYASKAVLVKLSDFGLAKTMRRRKLFSVSLLTGVSVPQ
jgi:hypothetical protein